MKKKPQPAKQAPTKKGFLALAGEAFHVLGEEIIEGKDKVVEVAGEKFANVKKSIHNLTHKKAAPAKRTAKKVTKKVAPKKAATKKAVSKKVAPKKVAPKKAAKKVAKKVVRAKSKA